MPCRTVEPSCQRALKLERVAFTGRLAAMTHVEAQSMVKNAAGLPVDRVSRATSILVVGMDGLPLIADGSVSHKLQRAKALQKQGFGIEIICEEAFLERIGLQQRRARLRKSYPAEHICELLQLDAQILRRWEQFGLVRSIEGRYDFQDMVSLRTIIDLAGRGVQLKTIASSIRRLAKVLPGTERPLAQLSIFIEHPKALAADFNGTRIAVDGQFLINYEEPDEPGPTALRWEDQDEMNAAEWLDRGITCEDEGRLEDAEAAYRAALSREKHFPEAHYNLGNVLRCQHRDGEAENHYKTATDQDPDMAVAWFNLSKVQEDGGRLDQSVASLKAATRVNPTYANAHFNLAVLYERWNRDDEAARHWSVYRKLGAARGAKDEGRDNALPVAAAGPPDHCPPPPTLLFSRAQEYATHLHPIPCSDEMQQERFDRQ